MKSSTRLFHFQTLANPRARRALVALALSVSAALIGAPELAHAAGSTQAQRQVDLELEEVEGASSYEIELNSKNSGKNQNFKMKKPHWKAAIRPGEYKLRMRSYDSRGVPGAWSESMPFLVKLPGPTLLAPAAHAIVKTKEDEKAEVDFRWQSVPGTKTYRVEVQPATGGAAIVESFSEAQGKIQLPVAQSYTWSVRAISKSGEEGETQETPGAFLLQGGPLATPAIEKPADLWVEKLTWAPTEFSDAYSYLLQRQNESGQWSRVELKEKVPQTEIPFPQTYSGGRYRLAVKAFGVNREPSKTSQIEFEVFKGDRSPAAVEESKLRYSLEKPTSWYFVASYLVSDVRYTGQHPEAAPNRTVSYNAMGGTGRLGLGYIDPKKNSGYLGLVDLSGFQIAGQSVTYAAAEAHYVRRYTWGRQMLRPSAGLFYKELIETQNETFNAQKFEHAKLSFAGPHIGVDLWRPFTPKLGLQMNARVYYGLFGLDTPNGRDQEPQMSFQLGVMGSYKIRPNITGFLGWAHRADKGAYESTPMNGTTSFASDGDRQKVSIEGDFVNLLLEWAF